MCKMENDNIVLTYRFKIVIFLYAIFKDYSIFRIDIIIRFLLNVFQLNSIIACYVCVQLISFFSKYMYLYTFY